MQLNEVQTYQLVVTKPLVWFQFKNLQRAGATGSCSALLSHRDTVLQDSVKKQMSEDPLSSVLCRMKAVSVTAVWTSSDSYHSGHITRTQFDRFIRSEVIQFSKIILIKVITSR